MAELWVKVEDTTWEQFVAPLSGSFHLILIGWGGTRWLCLKRILFSVALTIASMYYLYQLFSPGLRETMRFLDTAFYVRILIIGFLLNALFDWISLSVSIGYFKRMSETSDTAILGRLLLKDVGVAFACTLWVIPAAVGIMYLHTMLFGFALASGMYLSELFETIWFVPTIFLITSIGPTLLHMTVTLLFLALKLVEPVLKPITSLILRRLYEDKRSILAQIAIILGAIMTVAARYYK